MAKDCNDASDNTLLHSCVSKVSIDDAHDDTYPSPAVQFSESFHLLDSIREDTRKARSKHSQTINAAEFTSCQH